MYLFSRKKEQLKNVIRSHPPPNSNNVVQEYNEFRKDQFSVYLIRSDNLRLPKKNPRRATRAWIHP